MLKRLLMFLGLGLATPFSNAALADTSFFCKFACTPSVCGVSKAVLDRCKALCPHDTIKNCLQSAKSSGLFANSQQPPLLPPPGNYPLDDPQDHKVAAKEKAESADGEDDPSDSESASNANEDEDSDKKSDSEDDKEPDEDDAEDSEKSEVSEENDDDEEENGSSEDEDEE